MLSAIRNDGFPLDILGSLLVSLNRIATEHKGCLEAIASVNPNQA